MRGNLADDAWPGASGFGPSGGRERFYFRGLGLGQVFKNGLKIFGRIDPVAPTAPEHRVDYRAALAGLGMAHEQKVLLPDRRGPDGVLTKVMPPPDLCRVAP